MKKRLLQKSKDYKLIRDYNSRFLHYVNSFWYPRLILSVFVFVIYFLLAMDGYGESLFIQGANSLILFGLFFSYLIYSGVFNLMRAIFCVRHRIYPLYIGGGDIFNGWLEFDYKDWENASTDKKGYFSVLFYDLFVFFIVVLLIIAVTIKVIM